MLLKHGSIRGLSPYTTIQVTTTNPDKYIGVMDNLLTKTHTDGFTPDEVKDTKTVYVTTFLLSDGNQFGPGRFPGFK